MRELILNGKTFEVRPLKRKQVRELVKAGHVPDPDTTVAQSEATMDAWVSAAGFGPDVEDLDNPEFVKLFQGIFSETYGSPEEEKNF